MSTTTTMDRGTDVFHVGPHALRVLKIREGRWTFSVNGKQSLITFPTAATAWASGVHAAYCLDASPLTGPAA